ncbi:SIS domain-containing protein [Sphingomonas sp.]|uniref:SIS domain-containing protein n=1 Tax=Sphingomonas sp. TaxID=28214 RepID=UPI0035BBFA58
MIAAATLMWREAAEAPAAVARLSRNRDALATLTHRLRAAPPPLVVTCARGSSDHAATFAKYLMETALSVPVASFAPSISSIYHATPRLDGALCLAISQSGRSPDLLAAAGAARAAGAHLVAMVNVEGAPLAGLADTMLPLQAGPERSVAATKSLATAMAGILSLVAEWSGREALRDAVEAAPDALARAWELDWGAAVDLLQDARGLFVTGRGIGLAAAQEAALKLKETCGIHAEAFSAAELRHGPLTLIGPDFPVIAFRQADGTEASVDALTATAVAQGGRVLVAGRDLPVTDAPTVLQPLCQILSFYRATAELAVRRGRDPDRSTALSKVTETL